MDLLRVRATASGLVLGAIATVAAGACGGDDDTGGEGETVASVTAAVCAAYADVELSADEALAIDIDASTVPGLQAELAELTASVSAFAAEAGVDDEDIQAEIADAVAELPSDPDLGNQLQLNGVRDTRDIIVADVRAWLDDLDVDCP